MIRTGIIGYGLSGRVFHAPFIDVVEGFELSKISARENLYFDKKISNFVLKNIKINSNKIIIDSKSFLNCDDALKHRVLKSIMPAKKSSGHINAIIKWAGDKKRAWNKKRAGAEKRGQDTDLGWRSKTKRAAASRSRSTRERAASPNR